MSMGDDIAAVYQLVGIQYTIVRPGGIRITGEALDYDDQKEIRPFFVEHFLRVSLPYTTQAVPGDLLLFPDGRKYLVAHYQQDVFQNEVISYGVVLYQCNVEVSNYRPTSSGTYDKTISFGTAINSNIDICWVSRDMNPFAETQQTPVQGVPAYSTMFYIPKQYDIQLHDRITISNYARGHGVAGAANYMAEQWDDATYIGLSIYYCAEDERA